MNSKFGSYVQPNWDWRAAGNFMFGGTGGALMLALAAASWQQSAPPLLGLSALAFVGLGLFLVWLEIGRPWRFLHVFFHPQTSWMTREGSVAVALFVVALAAVALASAPLMLAAGLLGLLFLYCQGRILIASRGIPAWREPAVMPLIVATGLAEGCALLVLIQSGLDLAPPGWLLPALLVLLIARSLAWFRYRTALGKSATPDGALRQLDRLRAPWLVGGNLLPLLIGAGAWSGIPHALPIAALLAALAGWHMKFVLVVRASFVQGYGMGTLQRGRPTPRRPVRRTGDPWRA